MSGSIAIEKFGFETEEPNSRAIDAEAVKKEEQSVERDARVEKDGTLDVFDIENISLRQLRQCGGRKA